MRSSRLCVVLAVALECTAPVRADQANDAWKPVGDALGRAGELAPDGSFKVPVLREDIAVKTARGIPVPEGLGLNGYAAIAGQPDESTVVGDTCLLEQEVNPEIDALRAGDIEVVAVHNHVLGDTPRIAFLHFHGRGNWVKLASTIRQAWALLGKVEAPAVAPAATAPIIDAAALAAILKRPEPAKPGDVVKFTLPRVARQL